MPLIIHITITREPASYITEPPIESQINAEYLAETLAMQLHNMFLDSREYVKAIIDTPQHNRVIYPGNEERHLAMIKRVLENRRRDGDAITTT